jgi:hypothetical protein
MSDSVAAHDPRMRATEDDDRAPDDYSNQLGSLDSCAIIVELEGLPYDFAFSEDDLYELFGRYGGVKLVEFLDPSISPDIALIEFRDPADAIAAVNHLNNQSFLFDGHQVVLSLSFYDDQTDQELQSKLRIATAQAMQQSGPAAVMTGSSYTKSTSINGTWQCRFVIGAEKMDANFPIVGRIIGPSGSHMKSIHEKTSAKLRLRGRRSNFREGPDNKETDDVMHLCVSSNDEVSYRRACEMVEALMGGVYTDYSSFCRVKGIPVPSIQLLCIDGPFTDNLETKIHEYYDQMMARTSY